MGLSPILDPNSTDKEVQQRQFKKVNDEIDKLKGSFGNLQDKKKEELIEVSRLRGQKTILLREIKELFNLVDFLKGGKEAYVEAYKQYGDERLAVLKGIGVALLKDVTGRENKLEVKSNALDNDEAFLLELADYLTQYGEICEATRATNALRTAEIVSEAMNVANDRKEAEKLLKIAKDKDNLSSSKVNDADNLFKTADSLVKFFQKEADKEHRKLDTRIKNIALNAKIVLEKEKTLNDRKKQLDKKEKFLIDKDLALNRKFQELGRIKSKLGVI